MNIHAIVAVGNQGQIGLNGKLPWHDKEDLRFFREMTMDSVCIAGWNTYKDLPELKGRLVVNDIRHWTPEKVLELLTSLYTGKKIFIIGGMKTYERYAHLINRWHISRVEYNGEADTYFNWEIMK